MSMRSYQVVSLAQPQFRIYKNYIRRPNDKKQTKTTEITPYIDKKGDRVLKAPSCQGTSRINMKLSIDGR